MAGALLAALALGRRVQCTVYTVKCEICSVGGLRQGGAGALQSRLAASCISPFGACHLSHMALRMRLGLFKILQVLLDLQHQLPILKKISIEAIFSISSSPSPGAQQEDTGARGPRQRTQWRQEGSGRQEEMLAEGWRVLC